jgi:hypothetical protein
MQLMAWSRSDRTLFKDWTYGVLLGLKASIRSSRSALSALSLLTQLTSTVTAAVTSSSGNASIKAVVKAQQFLDPFNCIRVGFSMAALRRSSCHPS